ncbi:MAG: 2,3-bisphosphoglycerate-independent phosphoglycerate mutase, partial [Clostridiales bacterium]|nr:2,3-bisphosphoglycerate-independent phosphoglycerate mutase [Clostridiales bacterium]
PDVPTYDLQPEMSAYAVTDRLVELINNDAYDVVVINYANCDMVGHTGVFDAAVKAVEAVDTCVGRLVDAVAQKGGIMLITADHGNADRMIGDDGQPFTPHTTNPVPVIIYGYGDCKLRTGGKLGDLAPTLLDMMNIQKPAQMSGESLIVK